MERDRERRPQHVDDVDRRLAAIETVVLADTRAARRAASVEDTEGRACVACGALQDESAGEFCRKCGTDLYWGCPRCAHRQRVWDRFCESCRCDSYAWRDTIRTRAAALRGTLPAHVEALRFSEALRGLTAVARFRHPATTTDRTWARRELVALRCTLRGQRKRRAQLVGDSERYRQEHRYREACTALAEIPADLMTTPLRTRSANLAQIMTKVQRLVQRIAEARKSARPYDCLGVLEEYLRLVPTDGAGVALLDDWKQIYERDAARRLRAAQAEPTVENYLDVITRFPDSAAATTAQPPAAKLLRAALLIEPGNGSKRDAYLRWRTSDLEAMDVAHAGLGSALGVGGIGMAMGCVVGLVFGAFLPLWGWIAAGFLGGLLAGVLAIAIDCRGRGCASNLYDRLVAQIASDWGLNRKTARVFAAVLVIVAGVAATYSYFGVWWRAFAGAGTAALIAGAIAAAIGHTRVLALSKAAIGPLPYSAYWRSSAALHDHAPAATAADADPQRVQLRVALAILAAALLIIVGMMMR
jgi:hypothetical protein